MFRFAALGCGTLLLLAGLALAAFAIFKASGVALTVMVAAVFASLVTALAIFFGRNPGRQHQDEIGDGEDEEQDEEAEEDDPPTLQSPAM